MLKNMLQDSQRFMASDSIDGALFKADIKTLPENTFSSKDDKPCS
ncbi:hypothetical protein [Alteromonas mediterranea]|nr:hypothetical protein [Alteromonas mediterranea]